MLNIIIGILLVIGAIISVLITTNQTPQNLRGFYSKFYWFISALAIIAGCYLIIIGVTGVIAAQ